MLGFLVKHMIRFCALCVLIAFSTAAFAQETVSRILTPAAPVSGTLDTTSLAQVFTFNGSAGQELSLTFNSGPGAAIIMTDANGNALVRATAGAGGARSTLELPKIVLEKDGVYYVTVFIFSDAFIPSEGAFTLTLNAAAAEQETPVAVATAQPTQGYVPPGQVVTTTGMQIALSWNSTADLNLQVRDPLGGNLFWDSRTTPTGGRFGFDANGLCQVLTNNPVEEAIWPGGAIPTGSYEILVFYRQSCQNEGPVSFNVSVVVDGTALPAISGTLPLPSPDQVFVTSFVINPDGTLTGRDGGLYDAVVSTPRNVPEAQPIALGAPVESDIVTSNPYKAFTFDGTANQLISITMNTTAGSLDTLVFLLGPNGNVITSNDDAEFGVTDSAIRNFRLPLTGQYTIVAARYGQVLGGTEGSFVLNLSGASGDIPEEVAALNLPEGDIEVTLLWNTNADLQLLVRDPSGNSVFDDTPIVPSGGRLVAAGNVNCIVSQTQPVSYIYWPKGFLRAGIYEVDVWYQSQCNDTRPVDFTLIVSVDGQVVFLDTGRPLPNDKYVSSFTIDVNRRVVANGGAIMDVREMNYVPELPSAPTITSGQPFVGSLSFDNPFDVYVFDGQVGDIVNISLRATAGNLDTMLYVLDSNGNLIAQNDDITAGEVTNSLVSDLVLTQDGRYIILATRFGINYGATVGQYDLTLTRQN